MIVDSSIDSQLASKELEKRDISPLSIDVSIRDSVLLVGTVLAGTVSGSVDVRQGQFLATSTRYSSR